MFSFGNIQRYTFKDGVRNSNYKKKQKRLRKIVEKNHAQCFRKPDAGGKIIKSTKKTDTLFSHSYLVLQRRNWDQ